MTKWFFLLCAIGFFLSGCAYRFQGSENPFQEIGINKIYIKNFTNETYRPGLEHLFTVAIVREFKKSKIFTIVSDPSQADAILTGVISIASSSPVGSTNVKVKGKDIQVAGQYSNAISCSVSLTEIGGKNIFSHTESRSVLSPAYALTGQEGSTVPLLNESEQRLAYANVVGQMMSNAYQRMVDIF